eukprot:8411953-Lingulodinium_polyedra.AAC.1
MGLHDHWRSHCATAMRSSSVGPTSLTSLGDQASVSPGHRHGNSISHSAMTPRERGNMLKN